MLDFVKVASDHARKNFSFPQKRLWRKAAPEANAADQATSGLSSQDQSCKAECKDGQGVCSNNICYCKTGFEGEKCEKVVPAVWNLATLSIALFLAFFGALFLAFLTDAAVKGCFREKKKTGYMRIRREVWRPSNEID